MHPYNLVALKLTDREKNYTYIKSNLSTNTMNYRPLPAVIVLNWESKIKILISSMLMNLVNPEWSNNTQKVALEVSGSH